MQDRWWLGILIALSAVGAADQVSAAGGKSPPGTGGIMLPPPDTEAAVRFEFERAKAKNTREALERFVRRHPESPLVEEAEKALDGMNPD